MDKCNVRLDALKQDVESYLWTFRWLWLINIVALVWGIISVNYELIAFASVSAVVALIGAARTRRGRRLVESAEEVCLPKRSSPDIEPSG